MTPEQIESWIKGWNGRCPLCPDVEMKARRSRCPYCGEWVTYIPHHPGHKVPRAGSRWNRKRMEDVPTGKIAWQKPLVTPAWVALMQHLNTADIHRRAT